MGCFQPRGKPGEVCVFKTDGVDDFESLPGYEYPYTLEELEGLRETCDLCKLMHDAIYRGGDFQTLLSRDPTSRIKLTWCQLPIHSRRSEDYTLSACLRVHLSKPVNDSPYKGSYAPALLRVYTRPGKLKMTN
jgi:hypothetical protein